MQWENDEAGFRTWREGRTGYPLVDAAMRELNGKGTIHNRLRMVAASFLVKDLGVDCHRGERYFADRLLDYDLAANNGGWLIGRNLRSTSPGLSCFSAAG